MAAEFEGDMEDQKRGYTYISKAPNKFAKCVTDSIRYK